MGLFKKIFKKEATHTPKGFHPLTVRNVVRRTNDTVEVQFDVPEELNDRFQFIPGQYLNFIVPLNGEELRRSYSICSGPGEPIAVAVKHISKGVVSAWFNKQLSTGNTLLVSEPHGHFTLQAEKNIIAVAAGSGITPIMSISKAIEQRNDASLQLFFANKTEHDILFKQEIDGLTRTHATFFLTQEDKEGFEHGRITKDRFVELIKADLQLLKADGYYLCGPEDMIFGVRDALTLFGVPAEKIHFELFTTPTHTPSEANTAPSNFKGKSKVKVTLDDEDFEFELDANGKTILEALGKEGADAPYSCKGGVCSTCRAKVVKGAVTMDLNYTLTDREIADGYILTCQSHPASEELIITYED